VKGKWKSARKCKKELARKTLIWPLLFKKTGNFSVFIFFVNFLKFNCLQINFLKRIYSDYFYI